MTAPTATPATVKVSPDERLSDLVARYAELKPRADDLGAKLKALSDAIKTELTNAAPRATAIQVDHPSGTLKVSYVESWTLDAKRMKAEDPATYVLYARKGGSWKLAAVKG